MRPPMIAVFFTLGGAAFMAGCAGSPPVKPDRGGDAADALSRDAPHRDDARDSADAPENQVLDVSRDTPPDVEDVGDTSHEDGGAPREIRCNGRDDNGDGEIDEGGGCWRLIAEEGAPSGRIFHTLIATPDGRAVVWGGGTADDITATGGIYDPGCDCWTATNLEGAPRPRSSHAATWTDNTMLKHKHADVGVAVSIPGGLITPIIRDACHKSLSQISNEMKDMAARAKARKLKPEEYQGGTTAVSNLGMFGVKDFAAIVNPPHATILAVGAGEQRVIVKGGQPTVATVMSVTLSTDHRAVDGALGAELLAAFKGYIEKPMAMLV